MTRKIVAFLTALCSVASAAALPVSACDCYDSGYLEYFPESGATVKVEARNVIGLIVETDGTELTADMMADPERILKIEPFAADGVFAWGYTVSNYTPESVAYKVFFDASCSQNDRISIARACMLEHDFVTDTQLVHETVYSSARLFHNYLLYLKHGDVVIDAEHYPEFEGMDIGEVQYSEKSHLYSCSVSYRPQFDELTGQGMSPMDAHTHYCDQRVLLQEKYSDTIESVGTGINVTADANTMARASSIWQDAGDSNTDGEVDAADAAEMLVSAAQIGTGVDVAVTSAADVNADGLLNAEDAAAVLSYAAAKGTGADVSWVDILRR